MEMIDEIEYFEFSPLEFTSVLYSNLLDFLKAFSNRFKKNDRNGIYLFFEKNLSKAFDKFEVYVYNYIFKFPPSYFYDRIQSDIVHERKVGDEKREILNIIKIYEKKIGYLNEKKNYLYQLKNDNLRYANMLVHESTIKENCENIKLIEEFCENEFLLKLDLKDEEFLKDLMKNKDFKNNIYKNEFRELIKEKGTVEEIAEVIEKIKKI